MANGLIRVSLFLLLAALGSAVGQTELVEQDEMLAKAFREGPGSERVNDPFHVLRNQPELKSELSDTMRRVEEKYGFRMRLLIRPVWMGGTVQDLAADLQSVWFPQGDGLVMVLETDNRKLGLGVALHDNPEDGPWLVPTHASAAILKRVTDRLDQNLPLHEYLKNLVLDMATEHAAYLEKRLERPTLGRLLSENLFLIGALFLTSLGAILVAVLARASRTKEHHSIRRFPVVNVPERLGAPYGGGTIATRNFSNRSS